MINWMNAGDKSIKETRLNGTHKAKNVYALDVVLDENSDGILICDKIFLGKEHVDYAMKNTHELNHDDRIFCGVVRVKDIYIGDEFEQKQSGTTETVESSDIYPRV